MKNTTSSLKQTTCAYCGVGCGIDVSVSQNNEVTISGAADHPANFGKLCIKGSKLAETITNDGRLLTPMISNKAVSWPNAVKHVAGQLNKVIEQYGPDSVAFYVSGQLLTEDYYVANKLMKGYIGTANIDTNSRLCMSSAVSAYKRAFGEDLVPNSYQDLDNTDLIIMVGSNAAWTHPVLFQRMQRAKALNPQLNIIVIDPRSTPTSESADLTLNLKPGSDTALFNGLLAYLANHKLLDTDFIGNHCNNFNDTLAMAKKYTIEYVAQFCELKQTDILHFYKIFAATDKTVSFYSQGINQSSSGVDKCNAIINCHLASGKIGKLGCGPFSITGQPNAMGGREVGGLANQLAAHLDIENCEHQKIVQTFWQSPKIANKEGPKAVELFNKIKQGQIKAVWIMATNPVVSLPDSNQVIAALKACPLVIVSDCVDKNDTLSFADVKLPATGWLEKNGTVTNSERRISRQRGIMPPAGNAKHDWQIICDVAKAMGFNGGFNYSHPSEIFSEHAALSGYKNQGKRCFDISPLADLSIKEYDLLKPIQWPIKKTNGQTMGTDSLFTDKQFFTKNKKANFIAVEAKLSVAQTSDKYPILLNSGRIRDQWHSMTRTGTTSSLTEHINKPQLSLNPIQAEKLGIKTGDLVTTSSNTGNVILSALLTDHIRLGEAFAPIHWNKQYASNATISNLYSAITDPISGQPESKQTAIKIRKCEFKYHGQLQLSSDIKAQLTPVAEYWLKQRLNHSFNYDLADNKNGFITTHWYKPMMGKAGEWISLGQNNNAKQVMLYIINNKLKAVLMLSNQIIPDISPWIDHLFSQESINLKTIQQLLAAKPDNTFLKGKLICSCFKVYQNDITKAVQQGCNSIEKLGKKLKCGTHCGSCKSEINNLLNKTIITKPLVIKEGSAA
ncbi:nitrate reductase [Pseudoalteromonas denitrificans]|uniref:Assimilatory nitrate reductase (NADH) alpha subunit apoprotein n=1 Tax=Pseudoalteromonas denitrificans DSM 6059 TaxID=1123010 RepID=A0A1I1U9F7_9GAMM|nr:nitrate reductase [Pseudoalteromonas denitrificans]SFD64550.1 assimilatory nitrate reductase (NADH) alpha subunit apoprotein [Pseudoalteromonas denitrificans DSM 6059]